MPELVAMLESFFGLAVKEVGFANYLDVVQNTSEHMNAGIAFGRDGLRRQIAFIARVSMEEAPFLVAVPRIIGGVEVDPTLHRKNRQRY